jgi:hypothetical protein
MRRIVRIVAAAPLPEKDRPGIDIRRMELTLPRTMRGEDKKQSMLVLMSPETWVPQTRPLRAIKKLADEALVKLSPVFDAMYAEGGRPSIPPERLLKSMLLMALYSVPQRAAVLRAARLQPALPLVPRHGHGREELRTNGFQPQPRSADHPRRGRGVPARHRRAGSQGEPHER